MPLDFIFIYKCVFLTYFSLFLDILIIVYLKAGTFVCFINTIITETKSKIQIRKENRTITMNIKVENSCT